jgi:hypothetical protein
MKNITLYFCMLLLAIRTDAQTSANLDINQVKAMLNPAGDLFWDFHNAKYEIPKGKGVNSIFASNLWIGGLDSLGLLHVAAQTYRQNGTDFFQGPVMSASSYSAATDAQWNKVWLINKTTIDSFRQNLFSVIPVNISSWPAQGNLALGQGQYLAPFMDINGDGIYDPTSGDYPCIKGDQAVYFIYNDDRNTHTESGGSKLGVEIHGMAYEFHNSADSALNYTVFTNYQIINRSGHTYDSVYVGNWTDTDIGLPTDDFIACDVGRSAFYGYNGAPCDSNGAPGTYGCSPPAQAIVMIQGPLADPNDGIDNNHNGVIDEPGETWVMAHYTYYNNDVNPVNGNMRNAQAYYNYMHGKWGDNSLLTYGGNGVNTGVVCDYMFPGISDPSGWGTNHVPMPSWTEASSGNTPGDRRGLGSYGPITLHPGEEICAGFAYVWARDTSTQTGYPASHSIGKLQTYIDSVKKFYVANNLGNCDCNAVNIGQAGVQQYSNNFAFNVYPNPASDLLFLDFKMEPISASVELLDITGRGLSSQDVKDLHNQISIGELASGFYFIRIQQGTKTITRKFVKK